MIDILENPALIAAQRAEEKVNACLDAGRSFRLEAGAGAGKTYSLVSCLKRLIKERGSTLVQAGQKIACITFTEVGKNEIVQEIEDHPAILVETIHAFSWAFLRQFQKALRILVEKSDAYHEKIEQGGGIGLKHIEYDLGFFNIYDDRITLSHDDIPKFMAQLLRQKKFQNLLSQQFPVIFIDEYQDTDRQFMQAITENFLTPRQGPLFGLFGDHWQTIYRSEYELANYPIEEISKGSNFRSVPAIVNVLNELRPDLPQHVSDPQATGEARFFHTNAYEGERTNNTHSKGDVPKELARHIRETLVHRLKEEGWDLSKTKVLMLTHNVLAAEQGYPNIAELFKGRAESFAKKEDPTINFFAEKVEPMSAAYMESRYGDMFNILGVGPTITKHADKISWRNDMEALLKIRDYGTIGQIIEHLNQTKRPPLTERLLRYEESLDALDSRTVSDNMKFLERYQSLRNISYQEIIELVKFVEGSTPFATQHSVKGAEFENVLVVLGGGWNHYNWPQLFELLESKALNTKNTKGYYRARNLFYVSISRPMKRLAVLATQTMSAQALTAITRLFGAENVEELII